MKIWIDDIRVAPDGYVWCKSLDKAKTTIQHFEETIENALDEYDFPSTELWNTAVELIDVVDKYASEIQKWIKVTGRNYIIKIHG